MLLALSLTVSTTRLIMLRPGAVAAAPAAPTAAAAPAAAATRRLVALRFAAFAVAPFLPAAERRAFVARAFTDRFAAPLRAPIDRFFDDFLAPPFFREPPFFEDFFEERFFDAAMGPSPFRSVGVGYPLPEIRDHAAWQPRCTIGDVI
jgi:hypothetical protein